jgi:signal transduction histidine kinase/integral membrane sensor domain MASE1
MNHFWRYFTVVGLLSVAYFLMAQLAISILDLKASASPFWPPAGIALAALILQGQRIWPGVALGSFLFARFHEVSLLSACGLAFGSALQAVVGAELLHRMRFHPSLKRLQDVLQLLVFGAWVSPLVNATISTVVGCLSNTVAPPNWQENWRILWLGDWMGILVVTPLLLVLSHWIVDFRVLILGRRILRKDKKLLKLRRFGVIPNFLFPTPLSKGEAGGEIPCLAEAFVCFALLFTISWFVFGATTGIGIARYPLEYLPFPFVVWAALRFAQRGAVVATLIVSVTAIWGVAQKVGPFVAKAGDFYQAILFLHGFMSIVIIMALVLAATGSERTFAVDLLKEREASLANAQRLAQLGNWDFYETCQGRKEPHQQLRWSDELYRLFGFTPKAFKPSWEAFFQVVHSADRDRVGEAIRGALRENKPYSLEYRILLPDGSQRVVCEQSEIHSGGISGTVQDVTERKHVEVQLRAVAERERLLGEMALRIRRSLNLDQILNTTVAEVRQFLKADRVFIGQIDAFKTNCDRSLQGLVIAESVDPSYPSLRSLILDDETSLREWRSLLEQSRIRVTEDTGAIAVPSQIAAYYSQYQIKALLAVPILLGDELYGALVVNQCEQSRHWQSWEIDWLTSLATQVAIAIQQAELYRQITDLNSHLESQVEERTQELSAKMAELQELNQLKDVFLQAVSHDLRTSLLGMSMVLNNLYQSSETTVTLSRPLIERMMVSNERQLNLIDSLLEDHFDEERQLELHSKPVQLEKLIQDLISDYSTKLALNKANLTLRLPEDCPLITADPKHLRRVLENLLTNALKHNPPGLNLNLQISVEDDMIRCTLQDDGVGISLEQQKSLFKLYIRGLHTQHLTGIGLGLYQCRQIIDAHGGEIGVISGPKAGSTFWFTLPVLKIGSGEW